MGGPVQVYVKRASGHSGSRWITTLLAAANMSTFFQWGGECDGACCRVPDLVAPAARVDALAELYACGCGCAAAPDAERTMQCGTRWRPAGGERDPSCSHENAYCGGGCGGGGADEACAGVATVAADPDDMESPPTTAESAAEAWPSAKAAARRAFHADLSARLPTLQFVTWDRDNAVKHALSFLKHNHRGDCGVAALANHGRGGANATGEEPRAFLVVNARRLAAEATGRALGRLALATAFAGLPVAYAAHYEAFQRDEAGETQCWNQSLVDGQPGISSNLSTSLKSNSFSMILEPLILATRVLDD